MTDFNRSYNPSSITPSAALTIPPVANSKAIATDLDVAVDLYVLLANGFSTPVNNVVNVIEVDEGEIHDFWSKNFSIANMTGGSDAYVALVSGGGTTSVPDDIAGIAPRPLPHVNTWVLFMGSNGFPIAKWRKNEVLGWSPNPITIVGIT